MPPALRKAWNSAPLALSNTAAGTGVALSPRIESTTTRTLRPPVLSVSVRVRKLEVVNEMLCLPLPAARGVDFLGEGLIDAVPGGDRRALRGGGGGERRRARAGDEVERPSCLLVGPEARRPSEPGPEGRRWSSRKPSSVPGARAPGMVICLGWPSPATSSSLPAACPVGVGHTSPLIWPCSDWGLPCRRCYQRRGGLLPHRFTLTRRLPAGRSVLCGPVRRLSAPRRYLAVYPVELGLSSRRLAAPATITLGQRGEYNARGKRARPGRRWAARRVYARSDARLSPRLPQPGQPLLRLADERLQGGVGGPPLAQHVLVLLPASARRPSCSKAAARSSRTRPSMPQRESKPAVRRAAGSKSCRVRRVAW